MSKATAITKKIDYTTEIKTSTHQLIVDEPTNEGGQDKGATPMELLASALASCSSITMKMYANRKGWNLDEAKVTVDFIRDTKAKITNFTKKIELVGNLDEEQKMRLYKIASRCPVHQVLVNTITINTEEN